MKTRTQLNLNVILNLYYCNYIYTTLQEKNLQYSVYYPSGVLGADSLGAGTRNFFLWEISNIRCRGR
jgi:hypothetical protein